MNSGAGIALSTARLNLLDNSSDRSEGNLTVVTLALVQAVLLGALAGTGGQSGGAVGTRGIANPAESLRVVDEGVCAEGSGFEVLKVLSIVSISSSVIIIDLTVGSTEIEGSSWRICCSQLSCVFKV